MAAITVSTLETASDRDRPPFLATMATRSAFFMPIATPSLAVAFYTTESCTPTVRLLEGRHLAAVDVAFEPQPLPRLALPTVEAYLKAAGRTYWVCLRARQYAAGPVESSFWVDYQGLSARLTHRAAFWKSHQRVVSYPGFSPRRGSPPGPEKE